MMEPEPSESNELLKADVLGRVRVRPEHRERMHYAFEDSAIVSSPVNETFRN
jgi:hypothetical protein